MLFTGLLINPDTVTPALRFLHTLSFFHAAFEALAVNELRYLHLREHKYGVDLDVPAATILSTFGLHVQVSVPLPLAEKAYSWSVLIVILVARYFLASHLLWCLHACELLDTTFFREREAVDEVIVMNISDTVLDEI